MAVAGERGFGDAVVQARRVWPSTQCLAKVAPRFGQDVPSGEGPAHDVDDRGDVGVYDR
ncbi:hypothetical protein ACFYXH_41390 [Streptomyces sp. NPDC002730]|uniref:hypothetical protein n=1 Tax=Streptomyces sp. NPDC002730 TaxID=3364662 RepID=UPI0036B65D55